MSHMLVKAAYITVISQCNETIERSLDQLDVLFVYYALKYIFIIDHHFETL